jgi:hypothetical protein
MNSDSLDDDPPDPLGVERENPLPAVFGTVRQRLKDQSKSAATTGTNQISRGDWWNTIWKPITVLPKAR